MGRLAQTRKVEKKRAIRVATNTTGVGRIRETYRLYAICEDFAHFNTMYRYYTPSTLEAFGF